MLNGFVKGLSVGPDLSQVKFPFDNLKCFIEFQVSVVLYDAKGVRDDSFLLNTYSTNTSLLSAISKLPSATGSTSTSFATALSFVRYAVLNTTNGYRGRQTFLTMINANPQYVIFCFQQLQFFLDFLETSMTTLQQSRTFKRPCTSIFTDLTCLMAAISQKVMAYIR